VEKFLENINFLSANKMNMCKSGCEKKENDFEKFNCNWICFNKLDRRYRDYWIK
jgi:hypothetical protein